MVKELKTQCQNNKVILKSYHKKIGDKESALITKKYQSVICKNKQTLKKQNLPENKYPFVKLINYTCRCVALNVNFSWCEENGLYQHQNIQVEGEVQSLPLCKKHLKTVLNQPNKNIYPKGFFFDSDQYKDTPDGKKIMKLITKKNEI
jgi:hypothetical protein